MSARTRRVVSLLGAVAGLTLALPALVSGATVAVGGGALTYTAAAGETNTPQFAFVPGNPGQYTVTGDAAPLVAGAGCAPITGGIGCPDTGILGIVGDLNDLNDQGGAIGPSVGVLSQFTGGDGNDTFTGGQRGDLFLGGLGNDTFNGGDGNDQIGGEAANDILNGGPANDVILGADGNDTLNGGDGEDRLRGQAGDDVENGENGFDFFADGSNDDPGADTYSGGPGVDTIFFSGSPSGVTVTLDGVTNDVQGLDTVGADVENVSGSGNADNITGNDGPNVLEGQAGADTINGEGGNDQVVGHSFAANGDGNNVVNGGPGNDILVDGGANDVLNGGDGDDELNAGPGSADMIGGNGNDTVSWGNFESYPTTFPILNQLTVTLDDVADDGYPNEGDNARADNENIVGFAFNDILRGNAAPNVINGGGGDDLIDLAGAGPDTAICGGGNETVIADADDNTAPEGGGFCNHVSLTGAHSVFIAQIASNKAKKGVAKVSVSCLPEALGLCDGSVRLLKGGTTIGREEFQLLPGEATVLGLELSDSARESLNKGKKLKVEMRALGTDNTGVQELDTASATLKGKKKKGK
jgi:Ca2+-binding RTX toxin-like protein